LPLSIAGVMSDDDGFQVAKAYAELNTLAKKLGSPLKAPFMTLSFMSLLVIPELKMSDKGLFDAQKFQFVDVCQP
ncbi:MAG: adenine deaminase, partial [Deltaproteobacteria bacterium]|nr:adenine deaminase [Deltaproteobacteria bacterium]